MSGLRCLVHSHEVRVRESVSRALAKTGRVTLLPALGSGVQLADVLRTADVDLLYADLGQEPSALLDLLEKLEAPRPALLLGGPQGDAAVLLRAMRLRPLEFFVDHQLGDGLGSLLAKLGEERSAQRGPSPRCTLGVTGAKGGVGTTAIACEIASALQALGQRVVVVDLNLHGGDVALHFDLAPAHSIADLAKKGDALDEAFLRSVLATHLSGVRVLAAPSDSESAALVAAGHVERVLRVLAQEFDWVILDLPTAWDLVTLRALHACDLMLIAATPDVPALTHARRKLELLERFGAPVEQIRVVLNRAGSSSAFAAREVREGLGRDVDAWLPADDAAMGTCVNEGKLLEHVQPGGKLHRALESLADQAWIWAGGDAPVRPAPTLLRRLRHYVAGS